MDWTILDEEPAEVEQTQAEKWRAAIQHRRAAFLGSFLDVTSALRKKALYSLRDVVKASAVADPDMGPFLANNVSRFIDLIWGDLMITIDMALEDSDQVEYGNHAALSKQGQPPRICTPSWWRARLLYCVLPFDKSAIGQIKDPIFWYFSFLSVVTAFGIRIIYSAILLVFICWDGRPDEFQIVSYILMFKGMTFLSSGVGMSIYATLGYWACVKPDGTHTCHIDGPAMKLDITTTAIDFCGSCVFTWIAFGLLLTGRCVHNGYKKFSAQEWKETFNDQKGHGGHLRPLFRYDIVSVIISIVVFMLVGWMDKVYSESQDELIRWDLHRAFFFGKVCFGLLSFPFLVLRLPVLNNVLCHTSPTGYNRNGVCVPYLLPPMPL